jgi:streptogramin lyase
MRRTYRAATVLAAAAATLTAGAAAVAAPAAGRAGKVTLYSARVFDGPRAMVAGPDGAMWFGSGNGLIGRITTP